MAAAQLSQEETQQLLRTVEMFEAITESQPNDYQSLEILKEAYNKLGRKEEALRISKRLAQAYVSLGHVSQAILEYEGIAQEFPDDAEARAALADLERETAPTEDGASSAPPLAEDSKPQPPPAGGPAGAPSISRRARPEDGDRLLANVLIAEKLVTPQAVEPLLEKLAAMRRNGADRVQPLSLAPLLVAEQIAKLEDILLVMVNKSRLPFMPLAIYDVDRDIARLLPQDICWQHCLVPFDLISRSVLIATANPFDHAARKQVEAMLDHHVFWYVAPPADIVAALRHAHGLDKAKPPTEAGP